MTKVTTKAPKKKGFGDLIEVIAKPIAKVIDKVTKGTVIETDIEGCEACDKRKAFLNGLGERLQGKMYREPTNEHLSILEAYFTRENDQRVSNYWQTMVLPVYNHMFYKNQRKTSCAPCWRKVEDRLKTVYDEADKA